MLQDTAGIHAALTGTEQEIARADADTDAVLALAGISDDVPLSVESLGELEAAYSLALEQCRVRVASRSCGNGNALG